MAPLVEKFDRDNRFVGVEVSAPMSAARRGRFKPLIHCGRVEIRGVDCLS